MAWESRALVEAYEQGKKEGRLKFIRKLMKFEIFNEGYSKERTFKKIIAIYPDQFDLEFLEEVYSSLEEER